ncbi:MAG TPA: hypothetical protein VFR47_31855 [Anaerolineales bacterium]|nr:hypothetical protein [Anaerolineales bacterium]
MRFSCCPSRERPYDQVFGLPQLPGCEDFYLKPCPLAGAYFLVLWDRAGLGRRLPVNEWDRLPPVGDFAKRKPTG